MPTPVSPPLPEVPLRVRILDSIRDVPEAAWEALVPEGAAPTVRHRWLDAMESSGSATTENGWTPRHLTLFRGETLVAASPAYEKSHSMGEYIYDFAWANAATQAGIRYYPKLLVGAPLSPTTAPRFLHLPSESHEVVRTLLADAAVALAETLQGSSVHILFPPEQDALALESEGWAHRVGMQYHWKNPGYASWDEFLSRFTSKRRHQLKREQAAAETQGIRISTLEGGALDRTHADLAWSFYEATCSKNGWGTVQLNREFFRRVFETMPSDLEFVEARRGDKVVAGAFNLVTPERLYGRYWGCLEEHPFLHFNVCMYHSIRQCIRSGRRVFEPGAGGEHKISRGFEPTAIHSAHRIFHPKLDRAIRDFVKREAAEVNQIVATSEEVSGLRPFQPATPGRD